MSKLLNPYRSAGLMVLPDVKKEKLAFDGRLNLVELARKNSLLCDPTIESRLVEILPRIGYMNDNCGIFIRKSHYLPNFPFGNIKAEDRFVAIRSDLFSGNNFDGKSLIVSGSYKGQSLESITNDVDILVRMHDESINNQERVMVSFDKYMLTFAGQAIGAVILGFYTNPVIAGVSFLAIMGGYIKKTNSSCRKAVEKPSLELSANVNLVGETVLFEAEQEYGRVLLSQRRWNLYYQFLDLGFNLDPEEFVELESELSKQHPNYRIISRAYNLDMDKLQSVFVDKEIQNELLKFLPETNEVKK